MNKHRALTVVTIISAALIALGGVFGVQGQVFAQSVGFSVGYNNPLVLTSANENLIYGLMSASSTAGSFLKLQKFTAPSTFQDIFAIDYQGNITTTGTLTGANSVWQTNGNNIYNSNTGNVGIGTTTPVSALQTWSNGDSQITISADADNSGEDDNPSLVLQQDGNLVNSIFGTAGNPNILYSGAIINAAYIESKDSGLNSAIQFVTGGNIIGGTNGTARMTILNNGNIGVGTTAPGFRLDVTNDIRATGNIYANNKIITSRYGHAGTYDSTQVQGIWSIGSGYQIDTANNNFGGQYGIVYAHTNAGTGAVNKPIAGFGHQILFVNNGSYKAAISSEYGHAYFNGNVGIGTTNPTARLYVSGGTVNVLNVGGGFIAGLNSTPVNTDQAVPLGYLQSNYVPIGSGSGGVGSGTSGQTLRHNGTSWVANSILVNNGTNVGVGATNPAYKLDVSGNLRVAAGSSVAALLNSTADAQLTLQSSDTWTGIAFDDSGATNDYIWYGGTNGTFAIGGGGANVSGKKLHVDGGMSIGANSDSSAAPTNGLYVEGSVGLGAAAATGKLEVNGNLVASSIRTTRQEADIAQGCSVSISGGSLLGGGPTSRTQNSYWQITAAGQTLTLNCGGWWHSGLSFSGSNRYNLAGTKLPAGFTVERSIDGGSSWLNVETVSNNTNNYYNVNLPDAPMIRITANSFQSGDTQAVISNIKVYALDDYAVSEPFGYTGGGNVVHIGNNVGIGTTSPITKLAVSGGTVNVLNVGGGFIAGLNSTPVNTDQAVPLGYIQSNYVPLGSGSGGVGSGTSGQTLRHNGTSWVANSTLYNNGTNVGVGTVSPGAKLHVGAGNILIDNNQYIATKRADGSVRAVAYYDSSNNFYLGSAAAGDTGNINLRAGDGVKLTVVGGTGNVGISSTNPGAKLEIVDSKSHVSGDLSGTDAILRLYNSYGSDVAEKGATLTFEDNYLGTNRTTRAAIKGGTATAGNTANGFLSFYTDAGSANSMQERMRVDYSGNVGIGITNPSTKLHISGGTVNVLNVGGGFIAGLNSTPVNTDQAVPLGYLQSNYVPIGSGSGGIGSGTSGQTLRHNGTSWVGNSTLYNNGTNIGIGTTNPALGLQVEKNNGNGWSALFRTSSTDNGILVGTRSAKPTLQGVNSGLGSATDLILQEIGGNVGIGTTNPAQKLDVNGGINLAGRTYTFDGVVRTFENVASYYPGSTPTTGTIAVTIANTPNVMLDAEIVIQGYNGLTKCQVRGYTYTGSTTWHQPAATCLSSGHSGGYTVRFGKRISDNARVILIGTTSSNWGNYPHVTIPRVTYGYPGSGSSIGDWSISIVTDESIYSNLEGVNENSGFAAYNSYLNGTTSFPGSGVWNSSGNVGIGTTNATSKLYVNGGAANVINVGGGFVAGLNSTPVNADQAVPLGYLQANYSSTSNQLWSGALNGNIWNGTAGAGNVGIGNNAPAQKLDVTGVITASTGFRVNNAVATAGQYLRGNGTNFVASTIQVSDVPTLNQNTTGYATLLHYEDNRTISPSELATNKLKFGFTAYNNNNAAPWADFLHLRSYHDSSGGNDNLLVFNKSAIGMRLYQQTYGSATAYASYKDVLMSDNSPTVNYLTKYTVAGTSVSVGKSLVYDNGTNVGIGTTSPITKLAVSGGTTNVINVGGGFVAGLNSTPVSADQAVPLGYLQSNYTPITGGGYYPLTGGNLDGPIYMNATTDVNRNISNVNTLSANKLNVNVIDPLYRIKGVNYSTYASSIVGGLKEEYLGRIKVASRNTEGDYQAILDFDKVEEGSDAWVWRQVVDFAPQNIEASLTPYGGFAQVYYAVGDNSIIFHADRPVEVSYRLVGKRFDWRLWPTLSDDQDSAGYPVK